MIQDLGDRGKQLHALYTQAVAQFKTNHIEEGITLLKCILNNSLIHHQHMTTLRYSSVISLGEFLANTPESQKQALNCFETGLALLVADVDNNMLRQNKTEEEFNLMIKMIQMAEQLNSTDRHMELLERAVAKSPLKWKRNLLQRLKQLYQKNGKFDKLLQLEHDFNDTYYQPHINEKEVLIDLEQAEKKEEEEPEHITKIKIRINLCQNQSELKWFSLWQKLLAMVYILLKSQKKRGLKGKEWLGKYKEQEEWKYFARCLDLQKTQIEIVFYEQEHANLLNQLNHQLDSEIRYGDMVRDISEQMLADRYAKIKQEMHKYEYKPKYKDLVDYYGELYLKAGFNTEWLQHLQFIDEQLFPACLARNRGQTNAPQRSIGSMGLTRQHNFDQEIVGVSAHIDDEDDRRACEYHRKLNYSIKHVLHIGSSLFQEEDNILFSNVQNMAERLTSQLLSEAISAPIATALLNNFSIRFILAKAILHVIQLNDNCFEQDYKKIQLSQTSLQNGDVFVFLKKKLLLLELLNLKLEQLINKQTRDEQFKAHQLNKISVLSRFIGKQLVDSTEVEYEEQLNSLSEDQLKLMAAIYEQKLKYHCLVGENSPKVEEATQKWVAMQIRLLHHYQDMYCQQDIQQLANSKISQWRRRSNNNKTREEEQLKLKQNYLDTFKRLPQMVEIRKHLKYLSNADQKSMKDGSFNALKYIESITALFQLFFNQLQTPGRQITAAYLQLWSQSLKMRDIVQDVYQKFTNCEQMKGGNFDNAVYTKLLANLIKLYLLKKDGEGDYSIRIIFFITNILIKRWSSAEKEVYVPRSLFVYYQLIQYKDFSAKTLTVIRKRLYINMIVKNVESIYNNPIFEDQNCEYGQMKEAIIKMMEDIYTSSSFEPKKMEDCLGLYVFLLKSKGKLLDSGKYIFDQAYSRVIRASYSIYEQKRPEMVKYCPQFSQWMTIFDSYLLGQQANAKNYQQLLRILKQQHKICNCCCDLSNNNQLYVQSLHVLGKFFEAKPYTLDETDPMFDRRWQFNMLDQQFYLEYLFINLNSGQAWKNLIRANTFKVHIYYDSMVGNMLEDLRGKIDYTKRLIALAQESCSKDANLMRHCAYYSESMELLKIRDRQYKMTLKDLQGAGQSSARETKQSIKRYKQGLKKMLSMVTERYNADVRIRYMRVLELKLKLAWISLEKEYKEDDKKDAVIIELEEYQNPEQKVFKPFKVKEQLLEIISDIKGIVNDLPGDSHREQVLHLQEDLIMEMYIFLYRNMEYKFEKIINRLCEVIRVSSKTDQCRKLKQMQHTFNELQAISHLFENGQFITGRPTYRVNSDKMVVNKTDLEVYTVMFQNIFAPEKEIEKPNPTESLEEFLTSRKHPKARKTPENAAERYNERRRPIQLEDDNTSKTSVKINNFSDTASVSSHRSRKFQQQPMDLEFDRRSRRSSLRERVTANFNPDVHIEVGKYFYQRLKQYMMENESAASRFNSIHSVVGSYSFRLLLLQLTKIMQQLYRILLNLTKANNIKTTNRRILILVQLTISQLVLRYAGNWQKANDVIKQYYDLNSDDVVTINYERREQEQYRVEPITDFYHRSIVTQMTKMKFIQHLFRLFVKQGEKDTLLFLINKLLRLARGRVDRHTPKDLKIGVKLQMVSNQANGIVVQQLETVQTKPQEQKRQEIKFYYFLFEQGTTYLLQLFRKQTSYSELPQKYQKCFLALKGEIEKRMAKDENNFYFNKMQEFQEEYEEKFKKQMAVKRAKREGQKQIVVKKSRKEKAKIKLQGDVKNEAEGSTAYIKIEQHQKKKKTRMRRRKGRGRKKERSKKLKKTKGLRKSRNYRKKRGKKEDGSSSEEDMKIQQQIID